MHQTSPREAEELRAESIQLLMKNCPHPNPTSHWRNKKQSGNLKKKQSQVVLTADKGVAMAVLDREDYTDKAQLFLADTNTYNPITKDLTNSKTNLPKQSGTLKTREDSVTHLQESVPHQSSWP